MPIDINGKTILFEIALAAFVGLTKIAIRSVASDNLNKPIVTGFAEVNFINTGTPAISSKVIAASKPICMFPSFNFNCQILSKVEQQAKCYLTSSKI